MEWSIEKAPKFCPKCGIGTKKQTVNIMTDEEVKKSNEMWKGIMKMRGK